METIGMHRSIRRLIVVGLAVVLSACQSQPIKYYSPPVGLAANVSATIVGSKVPVRNIFFADEIAFVLVIDGLPLEEGARNYDSPTQLSPGVHVIKVGFLQGTGCAEAEFKLNVQRGHKYIAKAEKLARKGIFRKQDLKIWIENSEGNSVTDDVVVPFDYCGGGFGLIVV